MKKIIYSFVLVSLLISTNGCTLFRNPFKSWAKVETKVETTQKQIGTNQDLLTQEARNYIYGEKFVEEEVVSDEYAKKILKITDDHMRRHPKRRMTDDELDKLLSL